MRKLYPIVILCCCLIFSACKKPGKGGRATMNIYVFNGSVNVPHATVKIRYGATGFPGTMAQYDEEHIADYRGQISSDKLGRGDYYIYASKIDSSGTNPTFELLEGGTHFNINNRNGERSVVVDMALEPQ